MSDLQPLRSVQGALAELTAVFRDARSLPLSASCVVNRTEVLALLATVGKQLPVALDRAQEVLGDRQAVMEQGEREAERLVALAHHERQRVLAETDLVQEAQVEADRLLDQARIDAAALRVEVEEYVDAKLATFEVVLGKTLAAVERGRDKLAGRSELDALRAPADAEEPDAQVG